MAPCWLICGTILLLSSLRPVLSQSCGGPGTHGIPGSHGSYGADGLKGDKGEPGESFLSAQGLKGDPGARGPAGRPGPKGDPGETGPPGHSGSNGEKGRPFNPYTQRVLFSYKREINALPENDKPINFNRAVLVSPSTQMVSLTNGTFVCKTPGVYFFSFHISVKSRVCLKLMKDAEEYLSMCDNSEGFVVTSGSAVISLEVGETVSLQTTRYNNIVTTLDTGSHTFNGFLIY